jgi:hypothetical protein
MLKMDAALTASNGASKTKLVLNGSLINANPVAGSFESESILPLNNFDNPSLITKDSATLKSESIENVFDAGANGNADDNVIVLAEVSEAVIKIGEILEPPVSVILKYIFAYVFAGALDENDAGNFITVFVEPLAGKVPVMEEELTSNTLTVNECVVPTSDVVASLNFIILARKVPIFVELYAAVVATFTFAWSQA